MSSKIHNHIYNHIHNIHNTDSTLKRPSIINKKERLTNKYFTSRIESKVEYYKTIAKQGELLLEKLNSSGIKIGQPVFHKEYGVGILTDIEFEKNLDSKGLTKINTEIVIAQVITASGIVNITQWGRRSRDAKSYGERETRANHIAEEDLIHITKFIPLEELVPYTQQTAILFGE